MNLTCLGFRPPLMEYSKLLFIISLSCCFLISATQTLQAYENQVLLQLRKHLEYPVQLDVWENNSNSDLCSFPQTPHMSISCEGNSVSVLKIMGDKLSRVSDFNGYPISKQTLSQKFSIDSFVTTLTRLTNLRVLSLVSLGIWGPLPDKIHRLYSLELLDVSSNFIFGSIPPQISRQVKLNTLIFDSNFLNETIPNWLDSLSNLEILSLKNNQLKGEFPYSVVKITTLTDISLSHNALTGKLPDLSALINLHLLDLRSNGFSSQLPVFPKDLTTILLSNNSFSGDIDDQIGTLNQLQHLDFSYNFLTGNPPANLFSLPNISYLNLASNKLAGSFTNRLKCGKRLGFVDISNNKLTGTLPSCLIQNLNERVVQFGGNCFSVSVQNQHSASYCEDTKVKSKKGNAYWVLSGVIGSVLLLLLLLSLGIFIYRRRNYKGSTMTAPYAVPKLAEQNSKSETFYEQTDARVVSQTSKLDSQNEPVCRVFSLQELEKATNDYDYSTLIGEGSDGKLYKGKLENGSYIVIRHLPLYRKYSIRNLKLRLDLLSKLHHPHLVSFLGHCIENGVQDEFTATSVFLVYEFVPNGNFRTHLSETAPDKILTWPNRLAVLIGIAKAVHFLHTGVIPVSFSNRLESTNILLDEHNIPKLSDYGMPIITEDIEKHEGKGDSNKSWHITRLEDDVYNFGFILLESLVGPLASKKGEAFLLNEMTSFGSEDNGNKIVDPIVLTTCSHESLKTVISITNKCISPELSVRPSFEDVLWNLQYAAQVQAAADADQKSDSTSSHSLSNHL